MMNRSFASCKTAAMVAVVASLLGAVCATDPATVATWELDCNSDLIVSPPSGTKRVDERVLFSRHLLFLDTDVRGEKTHIV